MKTLARVLISFLVVLSLPSFAEDCAKLLGNYIQKNKIKMDDWPKLPGQLQMVKSATLLVRVDMQGKNLIRDFLPRLDDIPDLQTPQALTSFEKDRHYFYLTAHGPAKALETLHERLNSAGFKNAEFKFLDIAWTGQIALFPRMWILLDETYSVASIEAAHNEIEKRLALKEAFAVYDISAGREVFFYPRSGFGKEIDLEFLEAQTIKSYWMRRTPVSWSRYLLDRGDNFDSGSALFNGGWAILSSEAYAKIYGLARLASANLPQIADVDKALQTALRECVSQTCIVEPTVPVTTEERPFKLTVAARERIARVLKENSKGVQLSSAGGLKKILLSMARTIEGKAAQEKYKKAINAIGIKPYDYPQVTRGGIPPAERRFIEGWQAYLKARGSSYADLPPTLSHVIRAIREL